MTEQPRNPMAILRRKQVEAETGLSTSSIYDRMKHGTFPKNVRISTNSVGWRAGDIDKFLENPFAYKA